MKIKDLAEAAKVLQKAIDINKIKLGSRVLEIGSVCLGICEYGAAMRFNHLIYSLELDLDGETVVAGEAFNTENINPERQIIGRKIITIPECVQFTKIELENKKEN